MQEIIEQWKPVKGYEGIYEVSSLGRVKRLAGHRLRVSKLGEIHNYPVGEMVLKPKTKNRHYAHVRLRTGNGEDSEELHIHRLVAEAFIPNPDNLPHVRHKNGDIYDNRSDNLEWNEIGNTPDETDEDWRDVVGYEDKYEVSNMGRIRSKDHFATHKNAQRGAIQDFLHHGRILTQYLNKSGYYSVSMWNGSKMRREMVHQIVAHAFVSGYREGLVVNHLDENPQNNRADNLEWTDTRGNNIWGTRIDKVKQRFIDSGHARAVVQMDMEGKPIAEFPSVQEAARQTGIHRNSINQCLWGNCKHAKQTKWKYKE